MLDEQIFEGYLESFKPGKTDTAGFSKMKLKNEAISVALTAVNEKVNSWDELDELIQGFADLDGDGEVSDEEQEYFSALVSQTIHAFSYLGADNEHALKSIQREDNALIKKMIDSIKGSVDKDNRSESQIIQEYVADKGFKTMFECTDEEYDLITESMKDGEFDLPDGEIVLTKMEEKMVKKVRDGKVVWVKKKLKRKKIISSKVRAALKKARMKAHTGAAKRKRAKSMKISKQRGLS